MAKWMVWLAVAIGVLVLYHICYGLGTLLPANINWLMQARHDWGTHYLGWAFYKDEPWHFPLGKITGYNYPVGTNVGFTDSIPLMCIFFKLFAPLLPEDFQFFGLWLLGCHALLAYYSVRLLTRFRVNALIVVAGSLLVAFNPELIHRGMHPALCAQWLLVGSIYYYFLDPQKVPPKTILRYQLILLVLGALINPYLCLMVLGFSFALPVKLWLYQKAISRAQVLFFLGKTLFLLLFLWLLTGMIVLGQKEDLGVGGAYGLYTMNLNSLYNGGGFSRFTPFYKWVSWHQYEGYMYLGAGTLLLLLVSLIGGISRFAGQKWQGEAKSDPAEKSYSSLVPLLLLMAFFTLMAVSLSLSFNATVFLRLPAPAPFVRLEEVFRACGRFFWPPYYLIFFLALVLVSRLRMKEWISTVLILMAVVIQFYDIKKLLTSRNLALGTYLPPMHNAEWKQLMGESRQVLFFPAFSAPDIRKAAYQDFSYLALKAHRPVNLAYVARNDIRATRIFTDSINRIVEDGELSSGALYITDSAHLSHFAVSLRTKTARLGKLDSCYFVYVPVGKSKAFTALVDKIDAAVQPEVDKAIEGLKSGQPLQEVPAHPAGTLHSIRVWLDAAHFGGTVLSMSGFAFIDSTGNNKGDSVFLTFTSDQRSYVAPVVMVHRPDLSPHFHKPYLDDAGFNFMTFSDQLSPGIYRIGLEIKTAAGQIVYEPGLQLSGVPLPDYIKR